MTLSRTTARRAAALAWVGVMLAGGPGCAEAPRARLPWPRSLPEAQGFSGAGILSLVERAGQGEYGALHSLIIIRRRHLVLEAYFRGYAREDLHELFSVTKSVTAALVGIAIDRGLIDSVSLPLAQFLPDRSLEGGRQRITVEHLLTMTAGFAWDELEAPYGQDRNPVARLHDSEDWTGFVLRLPMADPPGTRFVYNSGASMLLAEVLRRATGTEAAGFARQGLFDPLGIGPAEWTVGPAGLTNTSWGLSLRPLDMARFGDMMLHAGIWDGRQVVPARWVRETLRPRIPGPEPFSYGYQWWIIRERTAPEIVFARGWGGQFIILVPAHDLVVVTTGGNYRGRDDQTLRLLQELLHILDSVPQ